MARILSCYTNNYGPLGVRAAVDGLAGTGINHVELALKGHDFGGLVIPESAIVNESTDPTILQAFVDQLAARQVTALSANVGGYDLRTAEGLAQTARRLRFAHEQFGIRIAVTSIGQPSDQGERRTIVNHLRTLGNLGLELGVNLSIETHKGPTQNADAMIALMREIDHPGVGINFDTSNLFYYNRDIDPVKELDRVKSWIRSAHLKDSRGRFEDWYFPALGDGGAVDFRQIREILDGVGFLGPYTIEIEGIGGEPEPGLEVRHDRVVRSVAHLRAAGYFEDNLR